MCLTSSQMILLLLVRGLHLGTTVLEKERMNARWYLVPNGGLESQIEN